MPHPGPSFIARRTSSDESSDSQDSDSYQSDNEQPDAPRVAQWVDVEELDDSVTVSSSDMERKDESSGLMTLKQDLSKLPLGALAKAHRVLKSAPQDGNDSDEDEDLNDDEEVNRSGPIHKVASASTQRGTRSIEHRSNKHGHITPVLRRVSTPMEVTSKKPVSRRRKVVEVHTVRPRDPRFSDISGSLSTDRFRSQYGFLSELHVGELSTLKQSLARARKMLISSPRDLREEREKEVKRLELAMKRAESTVNREKREDAEGNALKELQREEKGKRQAGKKGWWLKDADKRAVRVRARMDSIAASGGKQAVKKAIEKKQRKIGQKEKKSRPFAPPQKRQRDDEGTHEMRSKRRRMNN